jgi:hypothetical protein
MSPSQKEQRPGPQLLLVYLSYKNKSYGLDNPSLSRGYGEIAPPEFGKLPENLPRGSVSPASEFGINLPRGSVKSASEFGRLPEKILEKSPPEFVVFFLGVR